MSEKYFYIAVPQEQFQEVKHTFYEAPSSYLKVYNGDYIQQLESQVAELQQLAEERGKQIERCLIGGNSLASVMIGLSLPEEWHDWTHHQASEYFYGHYVEGQAFEYYETWLCWKALHDVGGEQRDE